MAIEDDDYVDYGAGDEEGGSGWGSLIWIIIGVAAIGWFIHDAYNDYKYGEKKPFWKGNEVIQVCKTPYYSSSDCYRLNTTLIDNKTAQIHFENGGYKYTYNLTCYFAAKFGDEPKYVFCRSWDEDNQQWDFMPLWAYYPSLEDLQKKMDAIKSK